MSMPDDPQPTTDPRRRFNGRERVALYQAGCRECRRPTPAQAHCAACHRTFGGVTGFDAHRLGGQCVDPARKGYHEINGIWRVPMDKTDMPKWKGASE